MTFRVLTLGFGTVRSVGAIPSGATKEGNTFSGFDLSLNRPVKIVPGWNWGCEVFGPTEPRFCVTDGQRKPLTGVPF